MFSRTTERILFLLSHTHLDPTVHRLILSLFLPHASLTPAEALELL
jgi:hypothetical protein